MKDIPVSLTELNDVLGVVFNNMRAVARWEILAASAVHFVVGREDQKLLYLLPKIASTWQFAQLAEEADRGKTWIQYLMGFYLKTPDHQPTERPVSGGGYEKFRSHVLVRSKQWILGECAKQWRGHMIPAEEASIEIFRFLCDVVDAHAHSHRQYFGDDKTTRYVSDEEKETVLRAMRPHLNSAADMKEVANIEWWLETQKGVPDEVRMMLVKARAKAGGIELALADMERRELLEPITSDSGKALAKGYLDRLAAIELWIRGLMDAMQPWKNDRLLSPKDEQIQGELSFSFESDRSVKLVITQLAFRCRYEDKDEWQLGTLDKIRGYIDKVPAFSGDPWTLKLEIVHMEPKDGFRWNTTIGKKQEDK